jgi:hypothetical protein
VKNAGLADIARLADDQMSEGTLLAVFVARNFTNPRESHEFPTALERVANLRNRDARGKRHRDGHTRLAIGLMAFDGTRKTN